MVSEQSKLTIQLYGMSTFGMDGDSASACSQVLEGLMDTGKFRDAACAQQLAGQDESSSRCSLVTG